MDSKGESWPFMGSKGEKLALRGKQRGKAGPSWEAKGKSWPFVGSKGGQLALNRKQKGKAGGHRIEVQGAGG